MVEIPIVNVELPKPENLVWGENYNEKKDKKKIYKILAYLAIIAAIIIFFRFALLAYLYIANLPKINSYDANIERIALTDDGKFAYIKLTGGNSKEIDSIKFVFRSNESEYVYETRDGIGEISYEQTNSFLSYFAHPEYQGSYDYTIKALDVGLDSFKGIIKVEVSIKYKDEKSGEIKEKTMDSTKKSDINVVRSGGYSGGGGGSGSSGGGSGGTSGNEPTCTPSCSGKTCGSDGCSGTCGSCSSGKICVSGNCYNNDKTYLNYQKHPHIRTFIYAYAAPENNLTEFAKCMNFVSEKYDVFVGKYPLQNYNPNTIILRYTNFETVQYGESNGAWDYFKNWTDSNVPNSNDYEDMFLHYKKDKKINYSYGELRRDMFNKYWLYDGTNYINKYYNDNSNNLGIILSNINSIMYLGNFEGRFNVINVTIKTPGNGLDIYLEYWDGSNWKELTVVDNTLDLTRNGLISFYPPTDWKKSRISSDNFESYYIRIRTRSIINPPDLISLRNEQYNNPINGIITFAGWDSLNDKDNDGFVNDIEFSNLVNPNATARYKYRSRLTYQESVSWYGSRFKINLGNPNSIAWHKDWLNYYIYNNESNDGVFEDNSLAYLYDPIDYILEYNNLNDLKLVYSNFFPFVKEGVKNKIAGFNVGPVTVSGMGPEESYQRKADMYFTERYIDDGLKLTWFESHLNDVKYRARNLSISSMISCSKTPYYTGDLNRSIIFDLAGYYIMAQYLPNAPSYFAFGGESFNYGIGWNSTTHKSDNWYDIFSYDIGKPLGEEYVFANGTDVTSNKQYKVYARMYSNALILIKPKPEYDSNDYSDLSKTMHLLPGKYKILNVDGTISNDIYTEIGLRNAEAVILIKVPDYNLNSSEPELPRYYVDTSYDLPTGGTTWRVKQGDNLQSIINNAQLGDVIIIDANATFIGNFILPNKNGSGWIYIVSSEIDQLKEGNRVGPNDAIHMPKIKNIGLGNTITSQYGAKNYRLSGLEITSEYNENNSLYVYQIISLSPNIGYKVNITIDTAISQLSENIIIDRCYIHGNPTGNIVDGISANVNKFGLIDSYISEIHNRHSEPHGIQIYYGKGPIKIDNNYIAGSGINLFIGDNIYNGSFLSDERIIASDVTITRNYLYKSLSWNPNHSSYAGIPWKVKNNLEFKAINRVLVEGNILENTWPSAQGGTMVLFHGIGGPLKHITFRNNKLKNAVGAISIVNYPNNVSNILIENNIVEEISYKFFNIGTSTIIPVINLSIKHNSMFGSANQAIRFDPFDNQIAVENFIFLNNIMKGNIWGTSTIEGITSVKKFVQNYNFNKNILVNTNSIYYNNDTNFINFYFPLNYTDIMFVDYTNKNYRLSQTSPYRNLGSDGKDIGADIKIIEEATRCTLSGQCN